MATNCEDVSAQMMELLYGELPADARASVNAHVAGCARCRTELAGFEKTRAVARRGLDEAPPPRAHAAIMQAAAAHLAAQAQPAARKAPVPDKVSFWDRLKVRWAFPTLATVGAVAVFMVANRVFLNPERTLERAPTVEAPEPPAMPSAAPSQEEMERKLEAARGHLRQRLNEEAQAGARVPDPAAKPDSLMGDEKPAARPGAGAPPKDFDGRGGKKKGEEAGRSFAQPPPAVASAPAARKARRDDAPWVDQFAPPPPPREEGTTVKRKAPAPEPLAKEAEGARAAAPTRRSASTPPASNKMAEAEKSAPTGSTTGLVGGGAGPQGKGEGFGSGAAQAAPAPRPVPAPKRVASASPPPVASAPAPVAAAAPTPPPPPPPAAKPRLKKSNVDDAALEGFAAEDAESKDEKKQSGAKVSANDVLFQRAERLFAEGRWTEAAAVYRELLRRDPHNDDAERWRRRLVAAQAAEVNERNANLAEKRSAEAARTRKAPAKAEKADKASKAAASEPAQ